MALQKSFVARTIYLLLLALLACVPAAQASEERVHIVASESGSYNLENQAFFAQGDVQIKYGDLLLYGNKLHADLSTGKVILEGDVRLNQDEQEVRGEYLLFDLETGEGTFDQAQAEIVLAQETGSILLSGQSLKFTDEKYTLTQGQFTTCDLEEPHFRLVTKELELVPGEKVIIRGVTYYEGRLPILYWPYLVIPLDSDTNPFTMPVFGFSEQEGYYMKNAFNYYFNSRSHGQVYVDLFTRLGVGIGLRHYYDTTSWGKGSFYLYGVPTSSSPIYSGAFDHEVVVGSLAFRTNTSLENSLFKRELRSDNQLTLHLPTLTASTWLNFRRRPEYHTTEERDLGLTWSQNLTDNWRFNLRGSITELHRSEVLRLVDYLASTTYQKGHHRLTLTMQQQFNPDLLDSNVAQDWRSVQRIPELKWETSNLGFSKLPLQSQFMWGHYGERPSLVTKNRIYGQLGSRTQVWQIKPGTSFNYQGNLNAAAYSDGKQQYWTYGRLALNHRFSNNLQLASAYRRRDVWGESPFRFDAQRPLQDLSVRLSYNDAKWRASASTNYDLNQRRFGALTIQANFRPTESWNMNLYASYDLNNRLLDRVVPMVEIQREQLDLHLGLRYRPAAQVLERVDARIGLPLGSTWKVSYDSIFEPPKGIFTKGEVSVTKDLHCRALTLSYDHVGKRVALQYTINAFPTLPIGWDSQGGLSLFDLEDVSDIIGVEE